MRRRIDGAARAQLVRAAPAALPPAAAVTDTVQTTTPPPPAESSQVESARREAAVMREQLQYARKALVEERVARVELAAEATRRIGALQHELQVASHATQEAAQARESRGVLIRFGVIALALLLVVILIAGGIQWLRLPASPPAAADAASTPPAQSGPAQSGPAPPAQLPRPPVSARLPEIPGPEPLPRQAPPPGGRAPAGTGSPQMQALTRLNDALEPVPAASLPAMLGAANRWLGVSGEPPCAVESPHGGVSLVIHSGGNKPLLSALTRCAEAVEHLTTSAGP